ncbi:N-acetylglucosamine-6-phosphate deacetylase, partial [Streptococcus agalactiae]|nr:N-acetylglucosamine-6-phosphate deacetylase [Streptococcus agalactiae]MCK6278604.1 N-acetylglucosamine-6-phosphate deacetylase [Streptococcus agalactiae]
MTKYIKADRFFYADHVKENGYLEIKANHVGKWIENKSGQEEILDNSGDQIAP